MAHGFIKSAKIREIFFHVLLMFHVMPNTIGVWEKIPSRATCSRFFKILV